MALTTTQFQSEVLAWYDQHGRKNLPWQQNIGAYSVWVSEIMLQQTRVNTVIPYYRRFMQRFADVRELASASADDVLHHWTGLGYYARARNLHKTAKIVTDQYDGNFPDDLDALNALPGIGRSTAGAIRSIAFQLPAAILDGNVKRVLARYAAIDGWPGSSGPLKKLWAVAEDLAPQARTADFSQAMMDLGATLCTADPDCQRCPVKPACKAFAEENPRVYPGKKPKKKLPVKHSCFLMLRNQRGEFLLQRNPPVGLWGGLWVFPQCESPDLIDETCAKLGVSAIGADVLAVERHTFSHFHLDYRPVRIQAEHCRPNILGEGSEHCWYDPQSPSNLGMPAPVVALFARQ